MENIGKARYGLVENTMFGIRIVAGIVTGIRYTEDKPVYEISFGKSRWWTSEISDSKEALAELLNIASLDRVKETHGLKIKYEK